MRLLRNAHPRVGHESDVEAVALGHATDLLFHGTGVGIDEDADHSTSRPPHSGLTGTRIGSRPARIEFLSDSKASSRRLVSELRAVDHEPVLDRPMDCAIEGLIDLEGVILSMSLVIPCFPQ